MRWTRIEEVVIMDWLIRRNEPGGRNYFQRGRFQSCPGPSASLLFLRPPSIVQRGKSMALPALLDVGSILVPISHAATPTGRDAYCFFLNVGN